MREGKLALADGSLFVGTAFGGETIRGGEVVFNTAHSGYQEVISDPSYTGQIICMTTPLQGNYGVNPEDDESPRPCVEGFVVRELSGLRSNFRSDRALDAWLARHGVPGLTGIDTRELTLKLRVDGAINGALATTDIDDDELIDRARALPSMAGQDLVRQVAAREPQTWSTGLEGELFDRARRMPIDKHVAALDCGMKRNILRHLVDIGCRVTIMPPTASAEQILALGADGLFVSNGPGDPAAVDYVVKLLGEVGPALPTFGICLGHQLLALALGASTFKLKFGHHGYNHPVKNLLTERVEITSQNHGFAVRQESLAGAGLEQTHVNLYDGTVEGFRHRELPLFAVQYHPEAAPGPHDAGYLFDVFRTLIEQRRPLTTAELEACQSAHAGRRPRALPA